jgi:proteasome lid subunit RPN8/RPN11
MVLDTKYLSPDVISFTENDISGWRDTIHRSLHYARGLCMAAGAYDGDTLVEAVGIIWSDSSISPLVNQARSSKRFAVSESLFAETLAQVDPAEKTMVSLYHSHPSGAMFPSSEDQASILTQFRREIFCPWTIIDPTSPPYAPRWGFWWAEGFSARDFSDFSIYGEIFESPVMEGRQTPRRLKVL